MRNVAKRIVAIVMVLALVFAFAPQRNVRADEGVDANGDGLVNGEDMGLDGEFVPEGGEDSLAVIDKEVQKEVNKEAKALGVPNAFYKHNFAEEYKEGKLTAPSGIKYSVASTDAGVEGIVIKGVDTGVLANTKIDLGEYDFGSLKVGRVVYNMLVKKNMKGKAYLYFGDSQTPFATITIKRCSDESWEETRAFSVDLRKAKLSGKGHVYLRFEANSAVNSSGTVIANSGKKGNLFLESIFFIRDTLPVLDFDLDNEVNSIEKINGSKLHTVTGYGDVNILIPDGYKSEYGGKMTSDTKLELDYLKGRGNSTWNTRKKPYKMKLDKAADLFGMGSNKNWVLLANYYDYTMMRNKMTYDMADNLSLEFSPKSIFVDVVISGEYYGCYQLSQQVRVDKANVNIDDLEKDFATSEPDITGGYLLTLGYSWLTESLDSSPSIRTNAAEFRVDRPEYDDCPEASKEAQLNYLTNYLEELDMLVEETVSANATAKAASKEATSKDAMVNGKNWRDLMDENSLIDYFFVQAFSRNGDAYGGSSTYLYKKRNGKLYWGPVWDFDWVAWGAYATSYTQNDMAAFDMFDLAPWVRKLVNNDKEFRDNFVKRWSIFKGEMEKLIADNGKIDQYKSQLYYPALANYQVRPSTLMEVNSDENHMKDASGNAYTLNYYNEVDRLKNFIREGLDLCNKSINMVGLPIKYSPVSFYVDNKKVGEVAYDEKNDCIDPTKMPKDPTKKGYVFDGWRVDGFVDKGVLFKPSGIIYEYNYDGTAEAAKVYASFIPKSEYVAADNIRVPASTLYVPAYKLEDGSYMPTNVFLDGFATISPDNVTVSQIKWYAGKDEKHLKEIVDGELNIAEGVGERVVKIVVGKKSKSVKIVALDPDKVDLPKSFSVKNSTTLPLKSYGEVGIKFNAGGKYVDYSAYTSMSYKSENPKIATVDKYGCIHAVGKGTTTIYTYKGTEEDLEIRSTKVTVTAAKPAKVTIKSAAKSASDKVKVTYNKVNKANGYQIAVYNSEEDAEANANAIVKKTTVKKQYILTSKKFKKNKTLYVRVRAFVKDGSRNVYGSWTTKAVNK